MVVAHLVLLLKPKILTLLFYRRNFLGRYFIDKKIAIVLVASWAPYLRQKSRVMPHW